MPYRRICRHFLKLFIHLRLCEYFAVFGFFARRFNLKDTGRERRLREEKERRKNFECGMEKGESMR